MKKRFQVALAALVTAFAATSAHAQSTYAATKYPIVLAHGWMAIQFNGVAENLQANGAKVYTTQVSAQNSSEVRGEQFLRQLRSILAVSGAQKVNLIGHSQGSQTIRYAASAMPTRVASVSSVGGIVKGTPVADLVALFNGTGVDDLTSAVFNALGSLSALGQGDASLPQDAKAALGSLTTAGSAAFNTRHPAAVPATACGQGAAVVNGIRYYSWSGVGQVTSLVDPSDYLLAATSLAFGFEPNDGLAGKCASHLGAVIRDDYPMNHLDEINQMFGVGSLFVDTLALYRQHANRLKLAGL